MSSSSLAGGGSLFSGFTRLCKGLSAILVFGYAVLQIFPSAVSYLALIPAKTLPFAWTLVTAGYIEHSLWEVLVNIVGLLFIGKLLEPIWGSKEFFKFVVVVNFFTSVCIFITAIALYLITRQESYIYTPLCGFHGVLSGLLVGIKQIIPDQELGVLKIKAKKPETNLRGDPSDDFAFSTFFPDSVRPVLDPIASVFNRILCMRSRISNEAKGHRLGGMPLPGSDEIEASRRRERGARALEERLSAEKAAQAGSAKDRSHRDTAENV